ncbi:MAG: ATP-dependent DNA helicase RecG [Chloroflexi bacterium]|nr:ATP-dependent DNA helicase RecG [Chloroflexota bacterium]
MISRDARIPTKLEALRNILRLEREKGFQDNAVSGGLDRFLERWLDELRPAVSGPADYSTLAPSERERWVKAILTRLENGGDAPKPSPAKPPAAPTSRGPQPQPQRAPAKKAVSRQPLSLDEPVTHLRGVGSQNYAKLGRLGLQTVRDLVYHFPFRYNDFSKIRSVSQLISGEEQTVVVTVWEAYTKRLNTMKRESTEAIVGDETGNIRVTWFNQPWIASQLEPGAKIVLSGQIKRFGSQCELTSPEWEPYRDLEELIHTGRLVPVYHSTEGLAQKGLRRIVKQALDASVSQVSDYLPADIKHRAGLMGLQNAVAQMHYPESEQDASAARRRLAFDELFLMQLAVFERRRQWREEGQGIPIKIDPAALTSFLDSLPFSLTGAQARALDELLEDMKRDRPMSRLLQGDVGSGKTVVAAAALLMSALDGYQGALMAPTEILAEQHFLSVTRLLSDVADVSREDSVASVSLPFSPKPVTIGLLLGSMTKRAKDRMHALIASGDVDILIGTHALIQSAVEIPRLAFVVVDEQHRFGVMQRASLRDKGQRPHVLAMSATPIPRSLALTLYGDLDLSVIDEMPPGRQQIRTRFVKQDQRAAAYHFIRKQVAEGRQAFIVCPLIEESEAVQAKAAVAEHERLSKEVFPDLRLGLIHGRLALREKEDVMEQFKRGDLDILVSTPVIEVGIDVPNATVMLIDGADRFGLSQLHQFRGRVGRGEHQSYCLLLAESPSVEAAERLKIVERTQDGFQLAEEDLKLRGPGEYMGTRQSGLPDLRVARITDQDILALARREAGKLLASDPKLAREENASLAARFMAYMAEKTGEMS